MSEAKQRVFDNIRKYTTERCPQPDIAAFKGIEYPDKVQQFKAIIAAVGGEVVDWDGIKPLGEVVQSLFPDCQRIISDVELGLPNVLTVEQAGDAQAMNGTDLLVLTTPFAVCENGYCWVQQKHEWRAQLFISENLLFILDRKDLVHNMHEAAHRMQEMSLDSEFSGFIAGPSKTADIEQSLVMGAHGARGVKILLR